MREILITGASRGLGDAFSCGVPDPGDRLWLASRSRPRSLARRDGVTRTWVEADLNTPGGADAIAAALKDRALDVLLYNAGLWEKAGFTPGYRFEESPDAETFNIITVNLASAITCIQRLLPNLRRGRNPKIIFIGSTSGLDNAGDREVAYTASKFGVRGAAHALREHVRADGIAVSVVNPGWMSAEIPWDTGLEKTLELSGGKQVPVHDLVAVVRCLLSLSQASCVKEVDIPAMADANV
jgi:short-subunit dehydrogenase